MLEIIGAVNLEDVDARALLCYVKVRHEYILDRKTDKQFDIDRHGIEKCLDNFLYYVVKLYRKEKWFKIKMGGSYENKGS